MENENLIIEIAGEEISDLYPRLIQLEVEHDIELAGMFRMQFSMLLNQDGTWTPLDDERLRIWRQVTISAGFEDVDEELMSGYITHVKPYFDSDPSACILEVWGIDKSILMDREEILKDWPNKKDGDIATEIFSGYGLTPDVEDTDIIHDEAISTIIQRETDIKFLRRLAIRNGYECYVEGDTGHFKSLGLNDPPQPVLSVHFGAETTVNRLSLMVNAMTPSNVAMYQIDRTSKEVLEAEASVSDQATLGGDDAQAMLAQGMNPGRMIVSRNAATGAPEMTALCQGLYHLAEWFVSGEGEIEANQYGHILKTRKTVPIRGIGETYSGLYYVVHVTHTFSDNGYIQSFKAKRNALMPTGTENFSSSGALG